jgi:hypothetical protein
MIQMFQKSKFVQHFLTNYKTLLPVWFVIVIFLSYMQIQFLGKEEIFSVFHSILIASLISI